MGRRIRWLAALFIVCFSLLLVQIANVQFRQAPALANSPQNPRNLIKRYDNQRGDILAADGTVLAESVRTRVGAYHYARLYPQGSLFSGVVGYWSPYYGTAGLEYQYDQDLKAQPQPKRSWHDLLTSPPASTDDVTVTLDPNLQRTARDALAQVFGPNKDGAVVAINPATGAVEAMYSSPSFDPAPLTSPNVSDEQFAMSLYEIADPEGFRPIVPLAAGWRFPPGSTSKVLTTAAVYDRAPALSNYSAPYVPCISLPQHGRQLCNDNYVPCGTTISVMLPESCDPGYATLGMTLGGTKLAAEARGFGYNRVPPIDLPGVVKSYFPSGTDFADDLPDVAYSSIGQQDVQTTTLQNALVASAIADGGVIMTPHLMAQIDDSGGRLVSSYQPTPWLRATSQGTSAKLTQLMQAVVTSGTAKGELAPWLDAAVKTGTAQTGNGTGETDDWMIGFAPASHPVIAVAVVVPYQSYSATGAAVAGPVMNAMLEAALAGQH